MSRRPPRAALRQEILVVAQRLFSTVGFRATSLQMIADQVGCSKAALLYHFRSKSAILDALVAGFAEDLDRVQARLVGVPPDQELSRFVELAVALVVKHRAALAMLRGLEDVADISPLVAHGQEWAEQVRGVLAGPSAPTSRRAAALAFEHGLLGACLALPDVGDDELAAALLEISARIFEIDPAGLAPADL